jgi:superfamily II DNA or RNA helicase
LGGFTATPIVESMAKAKELLKTSKGTTSGNDEGYISYFNELPQAIYPKIKMTKMIIPVQKIKKDRLKMAKSSKPESNFEAYVRAYQNRPKKEEITSNSEAEILKLCNYMNMGAYYTRVKDWFKNFEKEPIKWGSKLYHVIKDIEKHREKSLILIHRRAGYKGLVEAFRLISKAQMFPKCKFCYITAYDKRDSKNIKEFSKSNNMRGEKIKIFIADASQFNEGVSFLGVRKLYLFNPSLSYSQYLQLRGRAIRACSSHTPLKKNERTVEIINCIGDTGDIPSVDKFLMKKIDQEHYKYKNEMGFFKNQAVDYKILKKFFKQVGKG